MNSFFGKLEVINTYKTPVSSSDIEIHRGTNLGNPFPLKDYANDRVVCLEAFRELFLEELPLFFTKLKHFFYSNNDILLRCFCSPLMCHGDEYKDLIEFVRRFPVTTPVGELVSTYRASKNWVPLSELDGVTHINTYSKGKTELGRLLSNFAPTPFEMEGEGAFKSLEGYWYWKATGCKHEVLRLLVGYEAKSVGTSFPRVQVNGFDDAICKAVRAKIEQNDYLKQMLKETKLPFLHYYHYGQGMSALVRHARYPFMYEFNRIRSELNGSLPTIVAGSRTINKFSDIYDAILKSGMGISKIISGKAKGVDIAGWHYGNRHFIDVDEYPVSREEWGKSKAAGHIRNAAMEKVGEQGILLIDNYSTGSEGMLKLLETAKKPVHLVRF